MTPAAISAAPVQLTRETLNQDLVDRALASLPSPLSRRRYQRGIDSLFEFSGRRQITLTLLHKWRDDLAKRLKPPSVNVQVAAVKKMLREAARAGLVDRVTAAEFAELNGLPIRGRSTGNWLEREQCRALLAVPNRRTLKGKRAYCILALLLGCALRRTELVNLRAEQVQMREGRWVLTDLGGKGYRVRTVAVPGWVKEAIDGWAKAAEISSGPLIRTLNGKRALSSEAIWVVVQGAGAKIGVPSLRPHDLRRTCAKLCRGKGGRIEQIQAMLGHASIATTQRYLGTVQNLKHAVNDDLGIW